VALVARNSLEFRSARRDLTRGELCDGGPVRTRRVPRILSRNKQNQLDISIAAFDDEHALAVRGDCDGGRQRRGRRRYCGRRLGGDRHHVAPFYVLAVDHQHGNRILGAVGNPRQCPSRLMPCSKPACRPRSPVEFVNTERK